MSSRWKGQTRDQELVESGYLTEPDFVWFTESPAEAAAKRVRAVDQRLRYEELRKWAESQRDFRTWPPPGIRGV